MTKDIPEFSLQRMPVYLNYLRSLPDDGAYGYISSGAIAQGLGLGEVLVRKDLAYTGCAGKPKVGYNTAAEFNKKYMQLLEQNNHGN